MFGRLGYHNKTDAQPDKTGETIPLNPGGVGEELLENQNANEKHHLEGKLKELGL